MLLYVLEQRNKAYLVSDGTCDRLYVIPKTDGVFTVGEYTATVTDGVADVDFKWFLPSQPCSFVTGEGVPCECGIVEFDHYANPKPSPLHFRETMDALVSLDAMQKRLVALQDRILAVEQKIEYAGLDFLVKSESEESES